MSSSTLPVPRTDLLERPLEEELALFDVESGVVHTLNPSATLVWQGLVRSFDRAQLVAELAEAFGIDDREAERGVEEALTQFRRANLVEEE